MAKTKGIRPNESQQQYKRRLVRNIKQKVRRATKRGYFFEDLPELSKASIKTLETLQTDKIYEYGSYITKDSEVISGELGRELERRESARKGVLTKMKKQGKIPPEQEEIQINQAKLIVENLRERINSFQAPAYIKRKRKNKKTGKTYTYEQVNNADMESTVKMLNAILDKAIAEHGYDELANIIDKNMSEIEEVLNYLERYGINNDYEFGVQGHPRISKLIQILIPHALSMEETDDIFYAESSMEE